MSREDRNTAMIVILVLVVCTISLVAILNALWRLVSPGVSALVNVVGLNIQRVTIDYNFAVPVKPTSSPAPVSYDYNFALAKTQPVATDLALTQHQDKVVDITYAGSDTPQIISSISIPKLKLAAPILIGNDPQTALTVGWWSDPHSHWGEPGEVSVYCYRRYFAPSDSRSCWYLDRLAINDEIFLGSGDSLRSYQVVGINSFNTNDTTFQQISDSENYLKIVTTTPLLQNDKRLVILAKLKSS